MTVIEYVTAEVLRQGYNVQRLNGIRRVIWMLEAWLYAVPKAALRGPTLIDVLAIGQMIEPEKNSNGFRVEQMRITNSPDKLAEPEEIQARLIDLFLRRDSLTPLEFYREFEQIHPFIDGNGRTGKVLLNWLSGSLLADPVFPPNDFWGEWIANP